MKLTKSTLQQIIREELSKVTANTQPPSKKRAPAGHAYLRYAAIGAANLLMADISAERIKKNIEVFCALEAYRKTGTPPKLKPAAAGSSLEKSNKLIKYLIKHASDMSVKDLKLFMNYYKAGQVKVHPDRCSR